MNKYLSLVSLMVALAAGSAMAAGTQAGTTISNTATATFTDENGGNAQTVQSNNGVPVTTTVQAVPSFTITPDSSGTPLTAGFAPGTGNDVTVLPGQKDAYFKYVLTNTGNVPSESYSLSRITYNSGSANQANLRYYLDADGDGLLDVTKDTLVTTSSIDNVAPDQSKVFFVAFDTPAAAVNGQQFGSTPIGTRNANGAYDGGQTFSLSDSNNYGRATVKRIDANTLGPKDDSNADGKNDANGAALPATYTVAEPGGATTTVTYGTGSVQAQDTQSAVAYAKTAAQTITFINTLRNAGNIADSFTLTAPTSTQLQTAGFPVGTTVQLIDITSGNAVTTTPSLAGDASGNGQGGSYSFYVRVTLPAGAAPASPTTIPQVQITSTSVNMPSVSDTTLDQVKVQQGEFGNATPGTPGSPAADPSLNPTKGGTPGQSVTIPMDLYNGGNLTDTYTLSGTVTFTDTNGQVVTAPVTYYLADANGNPTGSPVTSQTLAPGVEAKLVGVVSVPTNAATGTATIAQSATLLNGATPVITYSDNNDTIQVGLQGGVLIKKFVDNTAKDDTANPYPAEPAYSADPSNYNTGAGSKAKPSDVLRYTIYGRNTRNAVIKNFVLSDAIPANTGLWTVSATYNANGSTYTTGLSTSAKVMYKVGNGAWSATAPTDKTLAAGTVVAVAYDWNNDNTISAADVLPAGAELKLVFKVQVK